MPSGRWSGKIDAIIEAALRSPRRARRPWAFVVITDKTLLDKLSVAKPGGAAFVKSAPVAVVVCGDPSASDCGSRIAPSLQLPCSMLPRTRLGSAGADEGE